MNDTLAPQDHPEPPPMLPQSQQPRTRTISPWLVVGSVLATLLVLNGAGSMIAFVGRQSDTVTAHLPARDNLTVDVNAGDVRVIADEASADGNTVDVTARRSWSLSRPELVWTGSGDTLDLTVKCRFTWVGWCDADLELRVPPGTHVQVKSDSGDLEASGLQRDVSLSTDSGSVSARNVLGDAALQTDSGDVALSGVTGDLTLDTDSGSIDVVGSAARTVEAHTDSGAVRIEFTQDPQRVAASTDSGDIDLRLPDTAGTAYQLDLRTDSGTTAGSVRTDPASTRTISAQSDSGDVEVAYR